MRTITPHFLVLVIRRRHLFLLIHPQQREKERVRGEKRKKNPHRVREKEEEKFIYLPNNVFFIFLVIISTFRDEKKMKNRMDGMVNGFALCRSTVFLTNIVTHFYSSLMNILFSSDSILTLSNSHLVICYKNESIYARYVWNKMEYKDIRLAELAMVIF